MQVYSSAAQLLPNHIFDANKPVIPTIDNFPISPHIRRSTEDVDRIPFLELSLVKGFPALRTMARLRAFQVLGILLSPMVSDL
jgi:hypothetical protein